MACSPEITNPTAHFGSGRFNLGTTEIRVLFRNRRWTSRLRGLLLVLFLAGCATTPVEIRQIERIPSPAFDLKSIHGVGFSEVNVRMPANIELAEVVPEEGGQAANALIMGPNPIAIGVIFLEGIAAGEVKSRIEEELLKSLKEVKFPEILQRSIVRRSREQFEDGGERTPGLEVVIHRYGFTSGPDGVVYVRPNFRNVQRFCSVIQADIILKSANQVLYKDRIFWEPFKRSMDLPPPQCASPAVFAAHEGKLARQTFEEAAQVLAAVILRRLRGKE